MEIQTDMQREGRRQTSTHVEKEKQDRKTDRQTIRKTENTERWEDTNVTGRQTDRLSKRQKDIETKM